MAEYFAGGHLRFVNGEWRDDNGDAIEISRVRHGRWVNWGKSGTQTYENYGTCSVCHEDAEIHTEHRNYCPNCGAKMDGGDSNSDMT